MKLKLLLLSCILFLSSSCSKIAKGDKTTLNLNLGFEPSTLDWNLATDSYSFDVISNLMVGLTRFGIDEDGAIISVPGCAKSWEISNNSTELLFDLDPLAKWTDGQRVIAQHFVDSFERALDPSTGAPYADLLSLIDLSETKALSDDKLFIKLKRPAAYFIYLTSYGLTLPIRKDLINKYGEAWTEPEHLVTNGPFKLSKWQHEYKILLKRNKDFHLYENSENQIEAIKFFMVPEQSSAFTLFKNDQFDWIDSRSIPNSEFLRISKRFTDSNTLVVDPVTKEKIRRVPLLRNTYIGFNNQSGPFTNKLVRKAFAYAINREKLTKVLGRGDIANATWIPPGLTQYFNSDKDLDYHPELARELLAQAGFKNGENFPEVEFMFPSVEIAKLLAETLQSMWKEELNIRVKLIGMEWKVFLSTLQRDPPDIFRLNWGADYPDPDTFMQLFTTHNRINYGKWSNAEYDSLVNQAAALTDVKARQKLYKKAEKILIDEEMGVTPIFVNTQLAIEKPYINNLIINSMDIVFLDEVEKDYN